MSWLVIAPRVVTCAACGCRLRADLRHFEGEPGRDARGCRVECAARLHDRSGRPA